MILKAFSLFDTKTGVFSPPFFLHHVGAAARAVGELVQDRNTTVGKHPNDFVLYCLGEFDDGTGALVAAPPNNLGVAASYLPEDRALPLFPSARAPAEVVSIDAVKEAS